MENKNLVEAGWNSKQFQSTPSLNMSCRNVEDINLVGNSYNHQSKYFTNLIQSPQLAPWFRFDNLMTLWLVKAANLEILQSKKVWEQKWDQRL